MGVKASRRGQEAAEGFFAEPPVTGVHPRGELERSFAIAASYLKRSEHAGGKRKPVFTLKHQATIRIRLPAGLRKPTRTFGTATTGHATITNGTVGTRKMPSSSAAKAGERFPGPE
jgi:hypothetical protein